MSAAWRMPWARVGALIFGVAWGAGQFAPLLLVYRDDVHLSTATINGLWIIYVIGLVPAMLFGGWISDRVGRRSLVRLAVVLSLLSSLSLLAGSALLPLLFAGRLLAGLASGAAFGPATAWIKEASSDASEETAARRAAVALSLGFGGAPLISGCVAAWLPAPDVLPFAIHAATVLLIIPYAWSAPEPPRRRPGTGEDRAGGGNLAAVLRGPQFLRNVVPTAPWVFGTASTVTAVLPELVIEGGSSPALAGAVSALTLGTGVAVQPLGKRLEAAHPGKSMHAGLLLTALGCGFGILTIAADQAFLLLPCAVIFGAAYGLVLVAGLVQVELLADPGDLASLTAAFYCLSYVGFTAPLVFTLGEKVLTDSEILVIGGAVALLTIPFLVPQRPGPAPGPGRGLDRRSYAAPAR